MSVMTPMGEDANLTITSEDGATVIFDDGNGNIREVCWLAPDGVYSDLVWLVKAAAQFHNITVYET